MSVLAVLQVATPASATNTLTPSVTPTPTPVSLVGDPTVESWITSIDLTNAKAKYGYMAYQKYNAAGGVSGMAQVSGTTDFISIPGVSKDYPNITVSATILSALAAGVVTFTILGTVSYTQVTPGLYTVTTE